MERFKVVFYEKEDGSRPAYDFILSLSEKMRAKIYKTASLLEVEGAKARMPYSEYLSDGIFQIRAQQEGNISRVLYFFAVGHLIWLYQKDPKNADRRN